LRDADSDATDLRESQTHNSDLAANRPRCRGVCRDWYRQLEVQRSSPSWVGFWFRGEKRAVPMSESEQRSVGEARAMISREIVRLQAEYYGKGPTKAKTYIVDDLVVVVLEESFTRAEKTLVDRGEREAIQQIRRRFQQQMADIFTSVVEQATGRRVRAFLSETNLEHDVSVETFLLADEHALVRALQRMAEGRLSGGGATS
jgi:uncharacterized protein YbcI